jgi:hypothetical protein
VRLFGTDRRVEKTIRSCNVWRPQGITIPEPANDLLAADAYRMPISLKEQRSAASRKDAMAAWSSKGSLSIVGSERRWKTLRQECIISLIKYKKLSKLLLRF